MIVDRSHIPGRRPKEYAGASPVMREFFSLIRRLGKLDKQVYQDIGVNKDIFTHWRMGTYAPNLSTLERALDKLGFELVIRRKA